MHTKICSQHRVARLSGGAADPRLRQVRRADRRGISASHPLHLAGLSALLGLAGCLGPTDAEPLRSGIFDFDVEGNACTNADHPTAAQVIQGPTAVAAAVVAARSTVACVTPSPFAPADWGGTRVCDTGPGDLFVNGTEGVFYEGTWTGSVRWLPLTRANIDTARSRLLATIGARSPRTRGIWFDGVECGAVAARAPVAAAECVDYIRAMVRTVRSAGLLVGGNINPRTVLGLTGDDRFDLAVVELTDDGNFFIDRVGVSEARRLVAALPVRTSPPGRRGVALQDPLRGAQAFALAAAIGSDVSLVLTGAAERPGCIPGFPCWGEEIWVMPFVGERLTHPCEIEHRRFHAHFLDRRGDTFFNDTGDTWWIAGREIPPHRGLVCLDGSCSIDPSFWSAPGTPPPPRDPVPPVLDAGASRWIEITSPSPGLTVPLGGSFTFSYWTTGLSSVRTELLAYGSPLPSGLVDAAGPTSSPGVPIELGPWLGLSVGTVVTLRVSGGGAVASRDVLVTAAAPSCVPSAGAWCSNGLGACARSGTVLCDGSCNAVPASPGVEACGNGLDDDCDGVAEEGCASITCGALPVGDPSFETSPGFSYSSSTSSTPWLAEVHAGASASMELAFVAGAPDGSRVARVVNRTVAPFDWNVQLGQTGISVRAGTTYRFTGRVRREDGTATLRLWAGEASGGYRPYATTDCTVSSGGWSTCSLEFRPFADEANAKISVVLGGSIGTTLVDSVAVVSCP